MVSKPHVIVIVGPTASGKTDLSIEIAKKTSGEVISADSRQVYRGLDIGSGKVTKKEMAGIPHHLIDIVDPKTVFTADDFVRLGKAAIEDIVARKKTPIVVGGTGFYIDALLGTVSLPAVPANASLRTQLESLTATELFAQLAKKDPERADTIDRHNKVRLVRALEIVEALGSVPKSLPTPTQYDIEWIGIDWPDDDLKARIHTRLVRRFEAIVAEVKALHKKGVTWKRLDELGLEYRYVGRFVQNIIDKETCLRELEKEIWKYAKRQRTYFRRNKAIDWRIQK
jgi:tRNA dimethylallyltransferase